MTMAENRMLLIWIATLTLTNVFLVFFFKLYKKEHFSYLDHKSKSFSAEAQMIATYGPDGAWLANPTKSFASEKSGMEQTGSLSGGFLGKTMKYY